MDTSSKYVVCKNMSLSLPRTVDSVSLYRLSNTLVKLSCAVVFALLPSYAQQAPGRNSRLHSDDSGIYVRFVGFRHFPRRLDVVHVVGAPETADDANHFAASRAVEFQGFIRMILASRFRASEENLPVLAMVKVLNEKLVYGLNSYVTRHPS